MPSIYIAKNGACTSSTAVVAVTHDPRIDDLAMMAAVKTPASYLGVMGSVRTSRARAERLSRIGGLTEAEIERINMPIGLNLGSKTPSEIALAIMADIVRVRRGRNLVEL
jgi:xanthine dehydrogenase accessory factor